MNCPNCAEPINEDAIFCRFCNLGLSTEHFVECPYCAELVKKGARRCRFCNEDIDAESETTNIGWGGRIRIKPKTSDSEADPERTSFKANYDLIRERCRVHLKNLQNEFKNMQVSEENQIHLRTAIRDRVNKDETPLTMMERGILLQNVLDEVFGFGPLGPLLRDPSVGDIFVNSFDKVWVERFRKIEKTSVAFDNDAHFRQTIDRILLPMGARFSQNNPVVNARLPNGSVVNVTMSVDGPTLTIKSFGLPAMSMEQILERECISKNMADFLRVCVLAKANILISGPAGSGKTTLASALLDFVPEKERVISIEENAELKSKHEHWVRLECSDSADGKLSKRALILAALKMMPDRIIPGDIKGEEAADLLMALHTDLSGSIASITANSTSDALFKLETLLRGSQEKLSHDTACRLIASTIQIVLCVRKQADGSRRVVEISEISGVEEDKVSLQKIFQIERQDEKDCLNCCFVASGYIPKILEQFANYELPYKREWFKG